MGYEYILDRVRRVAISYILLVLPYCSLLLLRALNFEHWKLKCLRKQNKTKNYPAVFTYIITLKNFIHAMKSLISASQDLKFEPRKENAELKSVTVVLSKEKGIACLTGNVQQLWGSVWGRGPTKEVRGNEAHTIPSSLAYTSWRSLEKLTYFNIRCTQLLAPPSSTLHAAQACSSGGPSGETLPVCSFFFLLQYHTPTATMMISTTPPITPPTMAPV